MRKFLLASAFALGAVGTAGTGFAQTAPASPIQGQLIAPPGSHVGVNNNNNTGAAARPGPGAVPTPGTVVIHLGGYVRTFYGHTWNSLMNTTPGFQVSTSQNLTYLRLYPGMDGRAANGLRYGASAEVRTNAMVVTSPSTSNNQGGGNAQNNSQTLYMRRAFTYIASDQVGILRIGQADGLISLFDGGRATGQGYSPGGSLNHSDLQGMIGGNTTPQFAFMSASGDEYDRQNIVYISPNFAGFELGVQYSPSAYSGGCGSPATSGCPNLTTSPVLTAAVADGQRYVNMIQAGGRYNGTVGPVNLLAWGVYSFAGHVNSSVPGGAAGARTAVGAPAGSSWNGQFENPNFGHVGVAVTAAGFTLGGSVVAGKMNGRMAAQPSGGADMMGWLVGLQYATGPLVVGGVFESINSQGAVAMTTLTQRNEHAFAVGGSYTLAPGLLLFADYVYQTRKQSGFNFLTNTPGVANNQVQGQGFVLGTQMTW